MASTRHELDFRLAVSSKMYHDFDDFLRLFLLTTSLTVSFLHTTKVLSLASAEKPQIRASPRIEIWQHATGASGLKTARQWPSGKGNISIMI